MTELTVDWLQRHLPAQTTIGDLGVAIEWYQVSDGHLCVWIGEDECFPLPTCEQLTAICAALGVPLQEDEP